jgi:hypothetical protein
MLAQVYPNPKPPKQAVAGELHKNSRLVVDKVCLNW